MLVSPPQPRHQRWQVRRRGPVDQKHRRDAERLVRRRAVAAARLGRQYGLGEVAIARALDLPPRTLRRWHQRWRADRLRSRPRGRPPQRGSRERRAEALKVILDQGLCVGVHELHRQFPDLAREELAELKRRLRHVIRRRKRGLLMRLLWTRPGSVWAADFSHPPTRIDGHFNRLLVVRDLASGYQLAAMPAIGESSKVLIAVLESLVKWFGAPLVLKSDNGSAFIAENTGEFIRSHGILPLFSPPHTPPYNGSVEAGIGSIKVRAFWAADSQGRSDWTCDDVEAAVQQANSTARPAGNNGPTPDEAWRNRIPIGKQERDDFLRSYRKHYAEECSKRGLPWATSLQHTVKSSIDRIAIRRTLTEHGYLLFRRRRIAQPINWFRAARITR